MKNYDVYVKDYICDVIDRQIVNLKKESIRQSEMICYCNGFIEGFYEAILVYKDEFYIYDLYDLKNFVLNYLHDKLKE